MRTLGGIVGPVRASSRAAVVFVLAGVFFAVSRVIPGFPHQDRDHLGSGPPSASDISWTSWALVFGLVAFLAAYIYFRWRSR